jgi:integrase
MPEHCGAGWRKICLYSCLYIWSIPMPRLKPADVAAAVASGITQKLPDGNSLFLFVRGGSALWIHQYREGKSMRSRSLGSAADMSPAAARRAREDFAAERRRSRIERRGLAVRLTTEPGREPERAPATVKRMRFADVVEAFLVVNMPTWKPDSQEPRKYRHLKTGGLGKLWADEIGQTDIETELQKRWGHALASADKYRMRIMQLISYAVAKGLRTDGPNPARKEVIKHLVANAPKSKPHKAMRSGDVPALMVDLVADGSNEARALAFLILTMTRTAEARDADWREIDVANKLWIIPGERMKEKVEHRVPLSSAALKLLGKPKKSGLVFGDLPHDALIEKLSELRPGDGYTVHGMRTAFRGDWSLKNGYPVELREMALAHSVGDAVIQAYSLPPAELYTVRIPMTLAWNDFCTGAITAH